MHPLLNERAVADLLSVSMPALRNWRRTPDKGPPWVKIEGSVRYPEPQLREWLASKVRGFVAQGHAGVATAVDFKMAQASDREAPAFAPDAVMVP